MTVILAWTVLGLAGFAFVLALQMRMLISVSLRRALAEKFGGDYRAAEHLASIAATRAPGSEDAGAQFLEATYPRPLAHLRLARRVTYTAPMAILLSLAWLRFAVGAF
ncbi:MAG: hypothetical protein KDA56_02105 [Hyphomonas sp.]|nr:hypothetical protein [Hyphomonas sp.]